MIDGSTLHARGDAAFTAEIERLVIQAGGARDDFEVDIPRGAPWVEVLAGTRRVFLKDSSRVVTAAGVDARGRYVVPLSEPR